MKTLSFFFLFAVLVFLPKTVFATTYYVGSTTAGAANCLTSAANNCLFATALAKPLVAGDTVMLASGTYTGANSMISCLNLNGSSGAPISIVATTDGGPLIDGENARIPVVINNCDYWTIRGMTARNSLTEVYYVLDSDHITLQRDTGWDGASGNNAIFSLESTSNSLVEDCAGWGNARKIFSDLNGTNNTKRRDFGIIQGTASFSATYELSYNSSGTICENCIATWNDPGGMSGAQLAPFAASGTAIGLNDNFSLLGSIAYITDTSTEAGYGVHVNSNTFDGATLRDVVSYLGPGVTIYPMVLANPKTDATATNITTISADGMANILQSDWTQTNFKTGTTVASVYGSESLYVNNGAKGATICNEYLDGVLTDTPLWPWPMNARIVTDMTTAGRTPIDVGADIQGIFGTFPSSCANSVAPPSTIIADSACTGTGSGTSVTFSCTVGDHANRESILFVAIGTTTGTTITSANYNGDSFGSQQCIADATGGGSELVLAGYTLLAPDTGTHTLTVNFSDTPAGSAAAMLTFYNVDQASPYRASNSTTNAGSGSSLTVTSAAGDMVVDAVYAWNSTTLTAGSGQTALFSSVQVGSDPDYFRSSDKLATGTQTNMGWTFSTNSDRIGACDFSLIPNPLTQPNFKNVFASPVIR